MSAPRLSEETKRQILDAYLAGEKIAVIAHLFGVDESYPRILFKRRVDRESRARNVSPKEIEYV